MSEKNRLILLVLDGWGYREDNEYNAVKLSNPVNFNNLWANNPHLLLNASEEWVGLPKGQMGNSEVGHTNIGAGRIVYQDFVKINKAISSGTIKSNPVIMQFIEEIKRANSRIHFLGLVSDGGVHSHIDHLKGLLQFFKDSGVKEAYIHVFTDGRDTPPKSGIHYVEELYNYTNSIRYGHIATITGRYYAMDRDRRWDRVKQAFDAILFGEGFLAETPKDAVLQAYGRGETDEFIKPAVMKNVDGTIKDGDGMFFFNFRSDRARELTYAFVNDDFNFFDRDKKPEVSFLTMTEYDKALKVKVAFPPEELTNIFGEVISKKDLKQLRIAETEKYAHVTFFFNGGREKIFSNELRILVPSPKNVPTYDKKPEMSVYEVTNKFKEAFEKENLDVVVMNFANPDMVGHSGVLDAAIKACKAVDNCLGEVIKVADESKAVLIVTADHGNSELMWDYETNGPHTAHTTNLVPFIIYNYDCKIADKVGKLADIAPTMLDILDIEKPEEMTGETLIVR